MDSKTSLISETERSGMMAVLRCRSLLIFAKDSSQSVRDFPKARISFNCLYDGREQILFSSGHLPNLVERLPHQTSISLVLDPFKRGNLIFLDQGINSMDRNGSRLFGDEFINPDNHSFVIFNRLLVLVGGLLNLLLDIAAPYSRKHSTH